MQPHLMLQRRDYHEENIFIYWLYGIYNFVSYYSFYVILHDAGIIYITYYIAVIFSFTIAASVAYVKFWDSI